MEAPSSKQALQQILPLLIYDGDCTFCIYWIHYWEKLTGNSIQYKPYQEVASQYPNISTQEFQKAIQYVSPDGKIASAAEASFLTLSHAPNNRIWLILYRKLPGFAFLSEKAYAIIAAHRTFFWRICILLWGRHYEPPRYDIISGLFLRILGLIYLVAFISFGTQALGLIGSQGISPVTELINAANLQLGIERYWYLPMVFWLNSSDLFIQITCWGGAIFAILLTLNILPRISLFFLFILYLSLSCAGQVFMSFQWDMFLLETGFLAFFLTRRSKVLGIWLLRWLLFRFMFAAGLVKIFSGEIAWQNFSSLSYHFLTQPLPTPLAWYAHHLPQSILIAGTIATLIIELFLSFFIFLPRKLRFIAAFSMLALQIIILITGNYNFFNILTIALCLTLFDDAALRTILPKFVFTIFSRKKLEKTSYNKNSIFANTLAILFILLSAIQFYIRFSGTTSIHLLSIYKIIEPLRIMNVYGPFAVITKERMEIIIEGSNDEINWSEYHFKYKPGDVNRRPLWNIPFQPRLDWQMWFAALSSPENNPWFLRFLKRLLENSPAVINLLETNPFPENPPIYIRAKFYEYNFTTPEEKSTTGAWWKKREVRLYFP